MTAELALDQNVLERFVRDTSSTVTALAERRDDLADLVSNTNTTFGAIAQENASLTGRSCCCRTRSGRPTPPS